MPHSASLVNLNFISQVVSERLWGQIVRKLQVASAPLTSCYLRDPGTIGSHSMCKRTLPHPWNVSHALFLRHT
jgi:hypothetical protein